jgi:hypothetical protein
MSSYGATTEARTIAPAVEHVYGAQAKSKLNRRNTKQKRPRVAAEPF